MIEVDRNDGSMIQRILGPSSEILSVTLAGNSKVFIVKKNKKSLVVKKYLGSIERINLSMNREIDALTFLKSKEIRSVPELIQFDRNERIVIMEYLSGTTPRANSESIEAIIKFAKLLNEVCMKDANFGYAIDGIIKTSDLFAQIESRIFSLQSKNSDSQLLAEARYSILSLKSQNLEDKIWSATYSVSDLGLHNMVRGREGIRFFDLEFFGADSPIKVIGDFLLHPKNSFPNILRHRFFSELKQVYGVTESSIVESLPIIALKWYMIVLPRLYSKTYLPLGYSHDEAVSLAENYLRMSRSSGDEILHRAVYDKS